MGKARTEAIRPRTQLKLCSRPETGDKFKLILFIGQIQPFQPAAVAADSSNVQRGSGTECGPAVARGPTFRRRSGALRESNESGGNSYLVLLSDGGATEGQIRNTKVLGGGRGRGGGGGPAIV